LGQIVLEGSGGIPQFINEAAAISAIKLA